MSFWDRFQYWGRGEYWVSEDEGAVAGNLTRAFALDYARGQSSLHPERTYLVARRDRRGVLHVVAHFSQADH